MKKIIIIFLTLFVVVGCSADYTLTINSNDSADEKIVIHNYADYYDYKTVDDIINETIMTTDMDYDYDDTNLTINRHTNKYINLMDNLEIGNYFGKIKISSNKISFEPNYDKCIFLFSDGGEFVSEDTIKINLKVPFKVKDSNADSVSDDYYSWTYGINECRKTAYIEMKDSIISIWTILFMVFLGVVTIVFIVLRKRNNVR